MDEPIFVIFNPRSGKGRGAQFVAPVLQGLANGEDWKMSWGWEQNWRHLRLGVDLPAPGKLPAAVGHYAPGAGCG